MKEKSLRGMCLAAIVFLFFIVGSAGALSDNGNAAKNDLPGDVYTAPIGGLTQSSVFAEPNSTYDIDYYFYSRGYGPGTVRCNLSAYDRYGYVSRDELSARMDPAEFSVEPGHIYHSQIHIVTGPDFASSAIVNSPPYRHMTYNIVIGLNVTLQDTTVHYADDTLYIQNEISPGQGVFESDELKIPVNNTVIDLHAGNQHLIPVEFHRGSGIGNVSYHISETPLNVTMTPPEFIAKSSDQWYPAQLSIQADRNLTPGNYSFTLDADGAEGMHSPYSRTFFVNVTTPEKAPTQSPLPVAFAVVSIIVAAGLPGSWGRRAKIL
jgi:hypothetical protein